MAVSSGGFILFRTNVRSHTLGGSSFLIFWIALEFSLKPREDDEYIGLKTIRCRPGAGNKRHPGQANGNEREPGPSGI